MSIEHRVTLRPVTWETDDGRYRVEFSDDTWNVEEYEPHGNHRRRVGSGIVTDAFDAHEALDAYLGDEGGE